MILAIGDVEKEPTAQFPDMGIREWRWVLSAKWCSLMLDREMRSERSPEWFPSCAYFHVNFRPFFWRRGYWSAYYDGNHQAFFFGPFSVNWMD